METVVDAHIVSAYFQESVLDMQATLTGSPSALVTRLGRQDRAFLDEDGHIEHEWRSVVEREWFDAWYAKLLLEGGAALIPTTTCQALCNKLWNLGFPRKHRDIWYVRTASAVASSHGSAVLLSEDMHFYNPAEKECAATRRLRILRSGDGPIARHLHRHANIEVLCLYTYCEAVGA